MLMKKQQSAMILLLTIMTSMIVASQQTKTPQDCCHDCRETFLACGEVCQEAPDLLLPGGVRAAVECLSACKTAQTSCMALGPCGGCADHGYNGCCASCNTATNECGYLSNRYGGNSSVLPCADFETACVARCLPESCLSDTPSCCDACSDDIFRACLRGCSDHDQYSSTVQCVTVCRINQISCSARCGGCGHGDQSGDCCSGCRATVSSCQGVFGAGSHVCNHYGDSCRLECDSKSDSLSISVLPNQFHVY